MSSEVTYDILLPTGKQISGIKPAALKKAIEEKKLPATTKIRKGPDGNWSTLKTQPAPPPQEPAQPPPPPAKEPEPTVSSIQLPEPETRVLCMLPEGSAPDVQVFRGSDGKFDVFQAGRELCSVPTWEAAQNLVKAIQPAPIVAAVAPAPTKRRKGMIETMFPDAIDYRDGGGLYRSDNPPPPPQTQQVVNNIHVHSGNKGLGLLIEIFLTPFTGFLLGGAGASVAGRGNGSLFLGVMLWIIAALCAVPTVGVSYFIFLPIMLFKWAVDIVSCLLAK
jgi:hypothetical protein